MFSLQWFLKKGTTFVEIFSLVTKIVKSGFHYLQIPLMCVVFESVPESQCLHLIQNWFEGSQYYLCNSLRPRKFSNTGNKDVVYKFVENLFEESES